MIATNDWQTKAQCDLFDHYLAATADIEDRVKVNNGYGYAECEWESFQHGWNATKLYFEVKGVAL